MGLFSRVSIKSRARTVSLLKFFGSKTFVRVFFATVYFRDLTISSAAKRISKMLGMPESTVKWHLRKLREMKLITSGDKNNPYRPLRITELGWEMLWHLEGDNID